MIGGRCTQSRNRDRNMNEIGIFTEDELEKMGRKELLQIIGKIAELANVSVQSMIPKNSPKSLTVDSILDYYDEKSGSNKLDSRHWDR